MTALIILIVVIVLILILVVIAFWDDFKTGREQKAFNKNVYQVLNYYVNENDQLLLNNVKLFLDGDKDKATEIDHIVLSDKYVYVIHDFAAIGGLYGNIEDQYLFCKDFKGNTVKILNPVVRNEKIVRKMEPTFHVAHEDRMFVSVVVFNNSLIVPTELCLKNQTEWFLPLRELEKTIKTAEKDEVAPIRHEQSEALAKMIKERSELTKRDIALFDVHRLQK